MLTRSEASILLSASWWAGETTNIRQPKSKAPKTREVSDLILILRSKVWKPDGRGVCWPGINPELEEEIPEVEQLPPPTSYWSGSLHGMLMLTLDGKVGSLSSPHWSRCKPLPQWAWKTLIITFSQWSVYSSGQSSQWMDHYNKLLIQSWVVWPWNSVLIYCCFHRRVSGLNTHFSDVIISSSCCPFTEKKSKFIIILLE